MSTRPEYGASLSREQVLNELHLLGVPVPVAAAAVNKADSDGAGPLPEYSLLVVRPERGVFKLQDY
jgi:hypothetical protein